MYHAELKKLSQFGILLHSSYSLVDLCDSAVSSDARLYVNPNHFLASTTQFNWKSDFNDVHNSNHHNNIPRSRFARMRAVDTKQGINE